MKAQDFLLCTFQGDKTSYIAEITEVFSGSFNCTFVHSGSRYTISSEEWRVIKSGGGFPAGTLITSDKLFQPSSAPLSILCYVVVTFADDRKYLGVLNYFDPDRNVTFLHSGSIYTFDNNDSIIESTGAYKIGDKIKGMEVYELYSSNSSQESAAGAIPLIDKIIQIAAGSEVANYRWKNRGIAPKGYIKGMAVVYGRVYTKFNNGDPAADDMAKAITGDDSRDALKWFDQQFINLGMDNSTDGADTLRHLFVLLTGLGMRESSGKYCEGRDMSASNITAETAEAGLFQTSYNARHANPLMSQLFDDYAGSTDFLDIFKEGVSCKSSELENYGTGDGFEFQRLTKTCPAFAAEFAAVGLRNVRKHWGPINMRTAEIRPECDAMLLKVQKVVDESVDSSELLKLTMTH